MTNTDLRKTQEIQSRVGNPYLSAWVSANAGTGKTYVLVRRVIRQLLAGARPEAILCITYTKAAAAEMSKRLLDLLSNWALLTDEALRKEIKGLTGADAPPTALDEARRLFARALESPGGLKIQTIHSFCSGLLARFPAEAGLQLGFRPLEDDEAARLLRTAVRSAAAQLSADDVFRSHLLRLGQRFQSEEEDSKSFSLSLEGVIRNYAQALRGASLRDFGVAKAIEALRTRMNIGADETQEALVEECVKALDLQFIREVITTFPALGKSPASIAERWKVALDDLNEANLFLEPFCLTAKAKTPYATRTTTKKRVMVDDFDARYEKLCETVLSFRERYFALSVLEENESIMWIAEIVLYTYRMEKARLGALDYEDLIYRTLELLQGVDFAWIRYKLDAGIDHILLDEAQDNSSTQWQVFHQLAEELAASDVEAAGVEAPRSVFVVGDPKQSIYAFQGAQASLFNEVRAGYEAQLGDRLASESLFLSFRTAQPVLDVVDRVFDREAFRVVSGAFPSHKSQHKERPGSVELWAQLEKPQKPERSLWNASVDDVEADSIDARVARKIAEDIREKLATGLRLACKDGRLATPSDFMILFQRRRTRFHEVLQVLTDLGIPCAGTDRLAVAQDPAVRDLINALRFATNTDDSLSLAVLLKSPFFGWSEDDLFALCSERKRQILWLELLHAASQKPGSKEAHAVATLREALDAGARLGPYALLTTLLDGGGETTGRSKLEQRFGRVYSDPVAAFLDEALRFEDVEPRSVQSFLHYAERLRSDIKRDPDGQADAGVRVMTVHGAKGLEAPIVYLADADFLKDPAQQTRNDPFAMLSVPELPVPLPVLLPSKAGLDAPLTAALREDVTDRHYEEYQRLLYVAATRAEEHLVICGGSDAKQERTWHGLASAAFDALKGTAAYHERGEGEDARRVYAVYKDFGERAELQHTAKNASIPPPWVNRVAVREEANPLIYPSEMGAEQLEAFEASVYGGSSSNAKLRGTLVHKLLEVLPEAPRDQWLSLASRMVDYHASRLGAQEGEALIDMTLSLLTNEQYKELFSDQGQAEVSIQGELDSKMVSGEIDRLLVTDTEVVVAEFKTTRWVPKSADAIPSSHREQVGAYRRLIAQVYPRRTVRALLIYVAAAKAYFVD